ncbi:MAG: FAD-binding protein, partial [Candidatus Dormibacterales bacterium]
MEVQETVETDVLVIGAGGAGMRAAISVAEAGLKTAVLSKSLLGKAHTVMAEGGAAGALANVAPLDSWKVHFSDTMNGGKLLNNWRMAELHAKEAPERILELERWGAIFDRNRHGLIHQRSFGGHTYPRLAHIGDRTGLEIIRALQDHLVHRHGVEVFMETTATSLLTARGRVVGALAYRR